VRQADNFSIVSIFYVSMEEGKVINENTPTWRGYLFPLRL
jgi:hypothetical protein